MAWTSVQPPTTNDPFMTVGFNEAWTFGGVSGGGSGGGTPGAGGGTVGGVPIPKQSIVETTFSVSGMDGDITEVVLGLYVLHKSVGDLEIRLLHPDATTLLIIDNRGGSGDNIGSASAMTFFDDTATTAISAGTAPFTGRYDPESPFTAFSGKDPNGTWTLRVTNQGNTAGSLQAATLLVGTTAEGIGGGGGSIPTTGQLWPR